ncbi:MAG TPA: DUF4142 domain-containing protein [Cytophagaceae bacterium]|jgi:putative membrane protein|nr:DUF4142 domain-containing protein [Cytophagaceae bacterium]
MKKKQLLGFLLSGILFVTILSACESKKTDDSKEAYGDLSDSMGDSKAMADNENDKKFMDEGMRKDARFAVSAADGGMLEIELGKLAETNASSDVVKQFAQHIVHDHGKGNEELQTIAHANVISLPDAPSAKSRKEIDKFTQKKGEEFDKDYIDFMVKDHKEDIAEFEKEVDKGNNPELKAWALKTLPVLKQHLQMAEDTHNALKK